MPVEIPLKLFGRVWRNNRRPIEEIEMIGVAFRFEKRDWMGIAFAANMKDLFWRIDEHGDPYSVEIMPLKSGSVCIKQELNVGLEDGEPDAPEEVEWCGDIWCGKWKAPKWPIDIYEYVMQKPA